MSIEECMDIVMAILLISSGILFIIVNVNYKPDTPPEEEKDEPKKQD